jgi:dTDP-4-dehydrorhamnose 3,5-epimerase
VNIIDTKLSGVKIIEPKVLGDKRGYFFESFRQDSYKKAGLDFNFVQDNMSSSACGVLRGLHYQLKHPQGKLVTVMQGEVFDVAVDIRYGSPTFGKWESVVLSAANHKQSYIPPGFAHGFLVLSESAIFHYKCSEYYHQEDEYGIVWNDPVVAIDWPLDIKPILSEKDEKYELLDSIPESNLPVY